MSFDLTTARLNAGHSMRSLADKLDIHEASLRRLESGGSVHPATAKKIADFFNVKATDVLGDKAAA